MINKTEDSRMMQVSIIIPIYNVKDYIDECIGSVLAQTYPFLEIILIDDGSSDGSEVICDNYADQDKRIKVIHQENAGVSSARNQGLEVATGEYVTFLDSDDIIAKNYIEVMKRHLEDTDVDIVKCDIKRFVYLSDIRQDALLRGDVQVKSSKQDLLDILYCKGAGKWGGPGAKLYKASIVYNMRFDITMAYDEDFDFLCRAVKSAEKISTIAFDGYMYRVRPGSAMQSGFKPKMLESIEKRLKEMDSDEQINRAQSTNILLNAIYRFALIRGDTNKFKSERDHLWQIITQLRFAAILDPMQRIDHKASSLASYLGKYFMAKTVRAAKKIKLTPEE